jgi:hypothetical protein
MMDQKSLIALFLHYWTLAKAQTSNSPPDLFGKEEKLDKLIIKNQIAYHFKKVVREINQELFVSRRIDVSLLFAGIQVLKRTESEVRRLCSSLPETGPVLSVINQPAVTNVVKTPVVETRVIHVDQTGQPINKEPFTLVPEPTYASFKEAKARCMALGMQLPEIYTVDQKSKLIDFLNKNSIAQCFAGIEPDLSDSIPRHISTQYPVWKTAYTEFHECGGNKPLTDVGWTLDDGHAKFLYTSDGMLCAAREVEGNPIMDGYYASHQYRERSKVLSQVMTRIVCTPKWDGMTNIDPPVDNLNRGGLTIKARYSRSIRSRRLRRSGNQPILTNMKNVQTLCFGVADQARESADDMQSKMTDLLALVDITVHSEVSNSSKHREKRVIPLFLMKFIFVTGVKLLWQLFGFVQKVKMNNRLKNIESMLQVTSNRSMQNSDAITNMTKLIYGNSLAINQLSIRVDGLEKRLELVEVQLGTLKDGVNGLAYKFETVTALVTIDNLVTRTKRSMDTGYSILKDIIHSSKQKQTSPLVLPLDQIELVQNEISRISTAVLDPDFAKMQSIVVSDPNDPSMLLVVVNMAALGRRNLELVHMVPVPYFETDGAYSIMLDYQNIVLDQSTHTFSILTKQEEYDCLLNRCYVGSSEQSLLEKSCGIPQFYDQHKNACVSESVITTGVFLKPMLPDGVIFALKDEVRSEVFCKDKPIGKPRKLRGTGILQLPNGCVLQVIDKEGKVTKIRGLPQYTMVTAGDIELMPNGPLSAIHTEIDTNHTQKVSTVDAYVESRVSSVIRQVEQVDNKMLEQHKHVWILTGTISLSIMLIVLAIYLLYRFSTRARRKIRDIRGNFSELKRKVLEPEIDIPININSGDPESGRPTAPPPQRRRDAWLRHLREQRQKARILNMHREQAEIDNQLDEKERSYMNMDELNSAEEEARYISRPLSRPSAFRPLGGLSVYSREYPREYPRIPTPMIKEAQDYELEKLKEETELVEQLNEALSPRLPRKIKELKKKI